VRSKGTGSVVDTKIPQENWNVDRLDGTGPSGITLNKDACFIAYFNFQWLGMGKTTFGFVVGADPTVKICHIEYHSNILDRVYMTSANLPVRWELFGAQADSMKATCCSVISEGGFEVDRGYPFSAHTTATRTAANGVGSPILGLRPASTLNGIPTNAVDFKLVEISVLNGTADILVHLVYNPTITGGTWSAVGSNSAAEYNSSVTSFSGGFELGCFFVPASTNQSKETANQTLLTRLPITLDPITGTPIPVLVVAEGLGGASNVRCSINWREIR
jgi:hypothetical protein